MYRGEMWTMVFPALSFELTFGVEEKRNVNQ